MKIKITRRHFLTAVGASAVATLPAPNLSAAKRHPSFGDGRKRLPPFAVRNRLNAVFPIPQRPNVLLITADDMSWDSLGANGCPLPDVTPHLDRLASEGVRFRHSHVNIAVCQPCRGTIATGRYPHRSGIEGFEHTRMKIPTIMQTLKDAGYLTGVFSKVDHSTPHADFVWDLKVRTADTCNGRDPERYYANAVRFIERAQAEGRPFYLMANSQDPHRPFDGAEKGKKSPVPCEFPPPSRRWTADEVPVPGFLPDLPPVRRESAQYFGSVRRLDDTVGALLRALEACRAAQNTITVFISDHGMSFPFSKATCYTAGTRVPWIMRWPGFIPQGVEERDHFISTIDFMPTILEAVGLPLPGGMDGVSFVPLLKGQRQAGRERVFKQFYRTSREEVFPMRGVEDKQYCYVFNPWSNGRRQFKAESMRGMTFPSMQRAAKHDKQIAKQVRTYLYRTPEELYDVIADPYCMHNLVGDPVYAEALERRRTTLAEWMRDKKDPALTAFLNREDKRACERLVRTTARGKRRVHLMTK